ncbi:MAG: hypothetical protein NZM07_02360 [Elioraea sp.]|nr:hypothetical protein [Elioraea sp.]
MLWLRERDVDIRRIRLRPYRAPGGQRVVDVQPIIPLPKTEDVQVRLEERPETARQSERGERENLAQLFLTALVKRANELGSPGRQNRTP